MKLLIAILISIFAVFPSVANARDMRISLIPIANENRNAAERSLLHSSRSLLAHPAFIAELTEAIVAEIGNTNNPELVKASLEVLADTIQKFVFALKISDIPQKEKDSLIRRKFSQVEKVTKLIEDNFKEPLNQPLERIAETIDPSSFYFSTTGRLIFLVASYGIESDLLSRKQRKTSIQHLRGLAGDQSVLPKDRATALYALAVSGNVGESHLDQTMELAVSRLSAEPQGLFYVRLLETAFQFMIDRTGSEKQNILARMLLLEKSNQAKTRFLLQYLGSDASCRVSFGARRGT